MLEGLCAAELDLVCAAYQAFLRVLRSCATDAEYNDISWIVELFIAKSSQWKEKVAGYYNIDVGSAKKIFTRAHLLGRNKPDHDAGESRWMQDVLPCILELQWAMQEGHRIIAGKCDKYKSILQLPKVIHARDPGKCGLCN